MRRFTRLTNAFSKKLENHAATVAPYFMYYNFGRVHQTLRMTPAMEAGVSDHVWSIEETVGLLQLSAPFWSLGRDRVHGVRRLRHLSIVAIPVRFPRAWAQRRSDADGGG